MSEVKRYTMMLRRNHWIMGVKKGGDVTLAPVGAEFVLGADFDALAAELASQVAWKERYMWEVLQAGERIRELEAAAAALNDARLEWAMTCECTCDACEVLSSRIAHMQHVALTPKEPTCGE